MKRLLALAAAIVMVVAAVLIRSRIDGKAEVATRSDPNGPLVVVCVTELAAACDAIKTVDPTITTKVEDAATTARSLAKDPHAVDGWVTLDPWPDITNGLVTQPVITAETPLASSPLVIAMVKEREVVLAPNCPNGTVDWRCLGDNVGRPWTDLTGGVKAWGNITVGFPPLTSATGVLLFGNAVSGYFGRADIATSDFETDAFNTWRGRVKNTFMETDPLVQFVQQLPTAFAAVGTTQAEEQTNVGARAAQVLVITPSPAATAIAVLAPVGTGARADRVAHLASATALAQALQQQGWAIGQIPATTGLPEPAVLLALSGL